MIIAITALLVVLVALMLVSLWRDYQEAQTTNGKIQQMEKRIKMLEDIIKVATGTESLQEDGYFEHNGRLLHDGVYRERKEDADGRNC